MRATAEISQLAQEVWLGTARPRSRASRSKLGLVALLAGSLTLVPAYAPAQQGNGPAPPPPPISGSRLRAESNVVRIDVEVTNSSGKPIKGLHADQFQITDNGKPEKISTFAYSDIEHLDTAGSESPSAPLVIPVDTPVGTSSDAVMEKVRDRRLIALFFDMTSMEPDDLTRAHDAALKFLKKQMSPADLVAVVTLSSNLKVLANFTNDRATLQKAVALILPGAASQLASPLYAAAENGEYDVQQDTGDAFTADETEFNVFNTDQKLEAIEGLVDVLAAIPGKKELVEFTGGITQTGEENRAELRAATDAANRADVSIYSIDARGMFATPPGGDATTAPATATSMFSGAAVYHQTDQREDSRDTLATLSTDTGGRAFFDLGDLSDAFPKIQEENNGYYLIGYDLPADAKRDGSWHAVRLKVNVPGAHVRYRNGYYAPRDFQHLQKEDRNQQLDDALREENPELDLPIAVETAMFRISDQQVYVPISAKLPSSALDWAQKHGRREAQFDFAAEVLTVPSGKSVAALRDTITVQLAEQRFQQVNRSSLVYQGGVILAPGVYRMKFVAREDESGKMGTFEEPLVIPQRPTAKISLSSVLLSSQLVPIEKSTEVQRKAEGLRAKLASTPLEMDGEKIVPSVTRFFTQQQTLYVFFQVYYPEKAGKDEPLDSNALRAGLVFFRGGVQVSTTPLLPPTAVDQKSRTASFRISLPLAKLPAGRYTVQAVGIAAGTQQAAFGRAYLALEQAPAGPAAPDQPKPPTP
jgi:VWFA-related protein